MFELSMAAPMEEPQALSISNMVNGISYVQEFSFFTKKITFLEISPIFLYFELRLDLAPTKFFSDTIQNINFSTLTRAENIFLSMQSNVLKRSNYLVFDIPCCHLSPHEPVSYGP